MNCLAIFYNLLIIKTHSAVTGQGHRMILWLRLQKLTNAHNWIQPYTHVTKVFPHVLTIFWYQNKSLLVIQTADIIIGQTEYLS